jgi:hypothetical protein
MFLTRRLHLSTLPLCGLLRWYNRRMSEVALSVNYYYTST